MWVKPAWQYGTSEETDKRVAEGVQNLKDSWEVILTELKRLRITILSEVPDIRSENPKAIFNLKVRATKDQLTDLVKCPKVAAVNLNFC